VHLLKGCASGFLLTIGLIWFAATLNPAVFWLVPILGTVPFGMGVGWCFTSSFTYLVAAYRPVAASCVAPSPRVADLAAQWRATLYAASSVLH